MAPYLVAVEHHRTKSKSISIQIHKTKPSLTPRHKTSQFRSLYWSQVKFDPPQWVQVYIDHPHQNQVNLDANTNTKRFPARIQKPSQFRPPPPTRKPSQSIIALKTSYFSARTRQFDPPNKKTVTFDPITKTKSTKIPTKIKVISSPLPKSSQFQCLHTKTKFISIRKLKPSIFRPRRKEEVNPNLYPL